jgi:hypothetical protein
MKNLYSGPGASDIRLLNPAISPEEWMELKGNTSRLLKIRGYDLSAQLLDSIPFELYDATNGFADEFCALYVSVPLNDYIKLDEYYQSSKYSIAFKIIATTISEIGPYIRFIAYELLQRASSTPVAPTTPKITSSVVDRALADAEHLIRTQGAVSGFDRAHTALHGYLQIICDSNSLSTQTDASITQLLKVIREQHPAFQDSTPYAEAVKRIINSVSTIVDTVNTLRNRGSVAHPNENLLDEPEAMLAVNSIRTLLHYLDQKFK